MFTGLITDVGQIRATEKRGDLRAEITTAYDMDGVDLGASICCNGVCLTVVSKTADSFTVDISAESTAVTTAQDWQAGTLVNLERSLKLGDEMGGHIVSGHVDCVGTIVGWMPTGDSIEMRIAVPARFAALLAAKGSVAVNGVSLTVNTVEDGADQSIFSINLIPHTQSVTAFRTADEGDTVNIEFDLLARYVARLHSLQT